jgi:O-antigen/teichoic acid export membrane protein
MSVIVDGGLSVGLARNSLGTFVAKAVVFLLHFPIGILTARFLGPGGKGVLSLLVVSLTMSVTLGNLGLGPASTYFIGRDRKSLPVIMGNLLTVTGIVGVILSGGGWLLLRYGRPDIYAQLPFWIWGIVLLLVPIHLLRMLLLQVLAAVLRIKEINLLEVASITLNLLLFILLVVVMNRGIGGAFLAYALPDALAAGVFLILVLRYGGRPTKPQWPLLQASLRFGVKTYLSSIMKRLNLRLDTFLVASLALNGVQATGVYSVAVGLAELVLFIPESIRLSLFPMVAAGSTVEANWLTSRACRHTLFLTISLALGFAVLGPFVIHQLYGKDFFGAVTPLLILLPGVILLSQTQIFYSDLNGRGKPGVSTISALMALMVTIVLDIVLIPRYGIVGAAVASTCAYSVEFVIAGSYFVFHSGLTWKEILVLRKSDLYYYFGLPALTNGVLSRRFSAARRTS